MIVTEKYLKKIFKTSPGDFSKRETYLIKHFLVNKDNIEKPIGIDTLQKAMNLADNNVKWILKVFLMANVQSKRKKSLNQVITTINGRIFKRKKIILILEGGRATLTLKGGKKGRLPMFPDRAGMGGKYVYQVDALKGKKISKERKTKGKTQEEKVKSEIFNILKTMETYLAPLDPIEAIIYTIQKLNDLIYPNKGSLDIWESGDWCRICATARKKGDKLIVKYMDTLITGERVSRRYEFTSYDLAFPGDESNVPSDLEWVFEMFDPLAKNLMKQLKKLKNKKMKNLDEHIVSLIIHNAEVFRDKYQIYWNTRFVIKSAEAMEEKLIKMGKELILMLKSIHTMFLRIGDVPPETPLQVKDYFGGSNNNTFTDLDLEEIWNS